MTAKEHLPLPIAVSMTARNEAHNLPRSLGSVRDWVEEIVVVVNDCTDDTEDIARSFGARVIEHPWEGYRDQKRFALSQVGAPWVLALDADEEVSQDLRDEIHLFFQGDHERYAGAMFPRKVWFMGRWITHGDWYPDWSLRLFRSGRGRWDGSPEHDKIVLQGQCYRLRGDLHHYSNPTLLSHVDKIGVFSDYFLQRQIASGRRWSAFETVFRPWWRFFRAYILRSGFLDGYPGYYIAKATAFATLVRYSRLYEHEVDKGIDTHTMKPTISLILNTYENPLALEKVLRALSKQTDASAEIIVADDGSGPATGEVVGSFIDRLRIKHCRQEHKGFRRSVVLNKAIARAAGDYLVFLDEDSVPAREFISDHAMLAERGYWVQGRRAFVDESCVGAFEPSYGHVLLLALRGKLSGLLKAARLPFPLVKRARKQRGILGCNLGIWRDDLIAVNGYDEMFTGWGREDADLGNRLYHLGRDRKFVYGRAIIYHLNHPVLPRDRLKTNQTLLEETLNENRIRARRGLDQYTIIGASACS